MIDEKAYIEKKSTMISSRFTNVLMSREDLIQDGRERLIRLKKKAPNIQGTYVLVCLRNKYRDLMKRAALERQIFTAMPPLEDIEEDSIIIDNSEKVDARIDADRIMNIVKSRGTELQYAIVSIILSDTSIIDTAKMLGFSRSKLWREIKKIKDLL